MSALRLLIPALRFAGGEAAFEEALRLAERGVGGFCVFGAPPDLGARLAGGLRGDDEQQGPGVDVLTARELDVLKGIAAGLSNKQIAADLGISRRLFKAVDASNRWMNGIHR